LGVCEEASLGVAVSDIKISPFHMNLNQVSYTLQTPGCQAVRLARLVKTTAERVGPRQPRGRIQGMPTCIRKSDVNLDDIKEFTTAPT
jgi:hypothetical protein